MSVLKLKQIGNSVGVILPKEVLARLKLKKDDAVYLTENANGITLSLIDPNFETQLDAARGIMKKRRAVLRELATKIA